MFCSESCDHGFNETSSGKRIDQPQQQQHPQQQQSHLNMCRAPSPTSMPTAEMCSKCEVEPGRVGICLVTEGPEGLSIDCNVPLPSSFNINEYQREIDCYPALNGNLNFQGFCMAQPPGSSSASAIDSQPPGCSYQFQSASPDMPCRPCCDQTLPQNPAPPPMFCPNFTTTTTLSPPLDCSCVLCPLQSDRGASYICSMFPLTHCSMQHLQRQQTMPHSCHYQAISLVPVQQPQPLLLPQIIRFDFPFPFLLSEHRQDKNKSCCEQSSPPLVLQLYAPAQSVNFCDCIAPTESCPNNTNPESNTAASVPSTTTPAPKPVTPPVLPPASAAPTSNAAKRSYPVQDKNTPQCSKGNVCMKCGNCWHCPRCSNCFWHPGLLRPNADRR